MVLDEKFPLPTAEELTVPEVNISSPVLRASAMFYGKYCDDINKEFMLCKTELKDPRRCIDEGKEVSRCAMDFFRKVKKSCKEELEWYAHCLEWNSKMLLFTFCRPEQRVWEECMTGQGFVRAPFGHFAQIRVHETKRPKPQVEFRKYEKLPSLPMEFPIDGPAQGGRGPFWE